MNPLQTKKNYRADTIPSPVGKPMDGWTDTHRDTNMQPRALQKQQHFSATSGMHSHIH